MSRKYNQAERSPKTQTNPSSRTNVQQRNEESKQTTWPKKIDNIASSKHTASKFIQNLKDGRLGAQNKIPPIPSARSHRDVDGDNVDDNGQDFEVVDEGSLPLKLFAGKKQSLSELSEESMSYIWLRRLKEIFLRMSDGKDEQNDDTFVEFDVSLAKTDLANTCDRYIENERPPLMKKDANATATATFDQQTGSLQHIQICIKELNDLIENPSSGGLSSLLDKCIRSLQEFDKNTQKIIDKLRKQQTRSPEPDAGTILKLLQSLQTIAEKKVKSELEIKQEWDMKKLYAEVFKMSYKRNRLITEVEKEELTPVKKGDDQPNFANAIWWYSCDKANIYYQINTILRLENFELLMSYRYYLSDLCRMIEYMYEERKRSHGDVSQKFYRAGHIDKRQLEKMGKQHKGQFISLVGFISATTDENIAKGYAKKQNTSKDNEKVLFEIKIEPQQPCTAFAYIDGISFHPEEKEVLFSMGSTFTVDATVEPKNGENFYRVQLTASEIDKTLVDDIRTKVDECSASGRAVLLAQYLVELGQYRAARKYLNSLLTQACDGGILVNDPNLAAIYRCLGMTYVRQGLHSDALKAFKQALNVQARLEYSNNNALANIHNNIGLAYIGLNHMDEAEETLRKALRIQLREVNSNQQDLASIYGNIGYVHYKKNDFDNALGAFSKAEKIYKQSSSKIAHDALEQSLIKAEYLTNYGHLLSAHKSLTNAQKQYSEALKLYKSLLPADDPKLMQTHMNIMYAHAQNEKYDEVTKRFEESAVQQLIDKQENNMFELNSSVRQASLAFLYNFVGACYAKQDLFDKAIRLWTRSLIFERKARLEQLLLGTTEGISSTSTQEQDMLISDSYHLAREHYSKPTEEINQANGEKTSQLLDVFCLGLLHAKLYNRHKAIEYLTKAATILQQSYSDVLFAVYLLLADIYKHQHKYEESVKNSERALEFLTSLQKSNHASEVFKFLKTQKDRVLEIEIKLSAIDCAIKTDQNNTDIATDLEMLEKSQRANDTDTKRISLKVIIYDTLARYFLMQKDYTSFDSVVEKSLVLKLRCFSQYHPSLAINLTLMAERYTEERRFREALAFYEQALEVHSLNLTDKHLKIRKICYAIGDIYCELDKLSNATEKYNVAENQSSDVDEDDALQEEMTSSEESTEILMARISMHRHLAHYHERKKAYKEAISEMNEIIDLLEEKLQSLSFDIHDETILIQENIDASTLIIRLQQLAVCYLQLGDIRDTEQEDRNGYKVALSIYMKLAQYDGEVENNKRVLLCKKLCKYYEDLEENEEALKYLKETIKLEKPTISTLYRLGRLNVACDELAEAMTNYQKILSDKSVNEQKGLEKIVQDKLNEVEAKVKTQERPWSTSSSKSSSSTSSVAVASPLDQLSRNPTNIDTTKQEKNEAAAGSTVDSSDPQIMAAAYLLLDDFDMTLKYYEKDIKKRGKNISDTNIFDAQIQKLEQESYTYEQQCILIFLPKVFHSLVNKIREMNNFEANNILELADSYFQCAHLYGRFSLHLKSIVSYISAFGIYASKSLDKIDDLTNEITTIINRFTAYELKPDDILKIYQRLMSPEDVAKIRLKIAAMYRDNEMDDVVDLDGDDDTSNESREIAVRWYRDCLSATDNVWVKGACYYNLLTLYRDFIYEDENGKSIVDDMIKSLQKLNTADRRLLITLALHFLKEYENNTGNSSAESIDRLQKLAKHPLDEKLGNDDTATIGHYLMESNDLVSAEEYWSSIAKQIECDIPGLALSLIRDPYSTFDQILDAIKQPENDINALVHQLLESLKKTGVYYALDAKNDHDQTTRTEFAQPAEYMYQMVAHLSKRLEVKNNRMNNNSTK